MFDKYDRESARIYDRTGLEERWGLGENECSFTKGRSMVQVVDKLWAREWIKR